MCVLTRGVYFSINVAMTGSGSRFLPVKLQFIHIYFGRKFASLQFSPKICHDAVLFCKLSQNVAHFRRDAHPRPPTHTSSELAG